ncbi:MAG: hypothetical protein R3277_03710 [Brumimicrobium sp.]|nr:hypothetical protein [Brumimicrobium sp.]
MKTKVCKKAPWERNKKFVKRNFDDAFKSLGIHAEFRDSKEIRSKMNSPVREI